MLGIKSWFKHLIVMTLSEWFNLISKMVAMIVLASQGCPEDKNQTMYIIKSSTQCLNTVIIFLFSSTTFCKVSHPLHSWHLGQGIMHCGERESSVHCRIFSRILALYSEIPGVHPPPHTLSYKTKNVLRTCQMPAKGQNCPQPQVEGWRLLI